MGKNHAPPVWAIVTAKPGDRQEALRARQEGKLWANWHHRPDGSRLNYAGKRVAKGPPRAWARTQGWPTPWWAFDKSFMKTMLENDDNFLLALSEAGVELYFLKQEHTLSREDLQELDDLYNERSGDGRPSGWGALVTALREIRHAIEAGVTINVEGKSLTTWNSFYTWAHGRYHMLEDGYDDWIGDG